MLLLLQSNNKSTNTQPASTRRRSREKLHNVLLTIATFSMAASAGEAKIVDVIDYFPVVGDDLSKVTWGHAINDKDLLEDNIKDDSIMMLEADVSAGRLIGQGPDDPNIPIMAHPPHTESNLSLKMWIDEVIKANENGRNKGAKLDFKDVSIVKESLEILKNRTEQINFPLWLNADILKGPGKEVRNPVDAETFLTLCAEYFPQATLSVGWTTQYIDGGEYTKEMVDEMVKVLEDNQVSQPVTFPIRAAFVAQSLNALDTLVEQVTGLAETTITVWSSESDSVDMLGLVALQDNLGQDGVYYDLPPDQQKAFEDAKKPSGSTANFQILPTNASALATAGIAIASALAALYLYE